MEWPEIWCLMEVSTMFYICRYCVFTWWGRVTGLSTAIAEKGARLPTFTVCLRKRCYLSFGGWSSVHTPNCIFDTLASKWQPCVPLTHFEELSSPIITLLCDKTTIALEQWRSRSVVNWPFEVDDAVVSRYNQNEVPMLGWYQYAEEQKWRFMVNYSSGPFGR